MAFTAMMARAPTYPEPDWVGPLMATTGFFALVGFAAMIASYVLSMARWSNDAVVSAARGALTVQHSGATESHEIVSAHVVSNAPGRARVEATTRGGDLVEVDVADPGRATELVAELGFAHGDRPVVYALGSRTRRFLHLAVGYGAYNVGMITATLLGFLLVALFSTPGPEPPAFQFSLIVAATALAYALGRRLVSAAEITVGSDGVRVVKHGFFRRFYPLADIVAAEQHSHGVPVHIRLRDGRVVVLGGVGVDVPRRDALARHIRALLAARDGVQTPQGESFARAGRSVRDWREHLRAMMEGGYRVASAAMPKEALAELVAKPGAPIDQRVGAALALRVSGDAEAPARIRVAAERCVDAQTRAALEAAAAEEIHDEEIERALRA